MHKIRSFLLKNKLYYIISILIVLFITIFAFYKTTVDWNSVYTNQTRFLNMYCLEDENGLTDNNCQYLIENNNQKKTTADTTTIYMSVLMSKYWTPINYFAILLLILPGLSNFIKILKSKFALNSLQRTTYKKFLIKQMLNCYKPIIIFPVILLFLYLLCFIYSGHFDTSWAVQFEYNMYLSFWYKSNLILFLIIYFLSIFIYTISLLNIGLIISRKNHNLIVVTIESFLLFIAIDIIIELFFGIVLSRLLGNGFSSRLNILNFFNVGYATTILEMILYSTLFVIMTFIVLIIVYNNKEKFIIDIEKNN